MAFILVRRGSYEDAGKVFTLSKPVTVIGRITTQNKPDIELNDEVVSRRHVEIILKDDGYWIKDLGSTNGTMLNDDRIIADNMYQLKHNSKIGLGLDGASARILLIFMESEDTNVIQRTEDTGDQSEEMSAVTWLSVDERKKEVVVDGEKKKLSKKEYELLLFLYKNAGNVCSRDEIIRVVWSESKDPYAISDATIDQLVHRLRERVEPDPANPSRIISKKSFGYMLV